MAKEEIVIVGARENNLKNIDLSIPKNKLVVFTGVSGSGKSTLAFDTIFAEGQRRYVESLSSYARQFLGSFEKPDVDSIDGLSPSISIDQKTTSHNPRSTVGTVTEIYDYLRLLFGRIGVAYCPTHNEKIKPYTAEQMAKIIVNENEVGTKVIILAPLVRNEKGSHYDTMEKFFKAGFSRLKIDSEPITRYPTIPLLDKNKKHNIDVVVDRLILKENDNERVLEALKAALNIANGYVDVEINGKIRLFSEHHSCPICGFSVPPIEPRIFSFNNPLGCCEDCNGLGVKVEASPDLLVPNQNLTLNEGAIKYYAQKGEETIEKHELNALCAYYKIPMDVPYRKLSEQQKNILMYGPKDVVTYTYESINGSLYKKTITEGIKTKIDRLYNSTTSSMMKEYYSSFMATRVCPSCKGARLNKKVLAIKVGGKNIYELCSMSLDKLLDFFNNIELSASEAKIAELVIAEIKNRLKFLIDVGLEYLTLARSAMSLSGGEAQRIRLATQIGSKLTGVLYVLDEPSIGLHQRDNDKLIATLKEMRDLGNSLIVVEHDEDTMREADFLVDIGPGAGEHGGEIVFAGKPEEIKKATNSLTADYLLGRKKIEVPSFRRPGVREVVIKGARCHNLKDIDVTFKTGCLNLVTGVSGSGKSSLVTEILYKKVRQHLGIGKDEPGECDGIEGIEYFDKVINVSQEPIGKTPRSNPATYVKVFDDIRELFALTKEARAKGFDKSTFSFNVKGGRCEACQGDGVKRISMNFLPDVYVECDECHGKRYTEEVLEVHYKGKNIYDVLNMRVEEAYEFFKNIPSIERKLKTLMDVGLSYIKLGQSSTTLSGGEAQRVKLAYELERPSTSSTLYILDEPTTGLHVSDIKYLMNVFNRLVDEGNTVVVIEHNLDVIKCADYIVDLGPEGGDNGGTLVATGTPEEIANNKKSYTGKYLKRYLKKEA